MIKELMLLLHIQLKNVNHVKILDQIIMLYIKKYIIIYI